jgi:acyl carrier protein
MSGPIGEERVLRELETALVATLRLEPGRVKPTSSLIRDLGAESLDFLDVNYRLEQTFGIKMARHFFLEHAEELFGEGSAVDDNGRLTPAAGALLKLRYPEVVLPADGRGLDMDEVPALVTVQAIVDATVAILDTLPERCSCGQAAWQAADGTHVTCAACGAAAVYVNGDELIRRWLRHTDEETGLFTGKGRGSTGAA